MGMRTVGLTLTCVVFLLAALAQLFFRENLADRRLRGISGDPTELEMFGPVTRHERLEPEALTAAV